MGMEKNDEEKKQKKSLRTQRKILRLTRKTKDIRNFIKHFLEEEPPFQADKITYYFSKRYSELISLVGVGFSSRNCVEPYDKINFHDFEKRNKNNFGPITPIIKHYKSSIKKDVPNKVTIRFDYYNDEKWRKLLLLVELFYLLFFGVSSKEVVARKLSLAVCWDLLDMPFKSMLYDLWEKISPPLVIRTTHVINLRRFVTAVGKVFPYAYSDAIFSRLEELCKDNNNVKFSIYDCFRFSKRFSLLSSEDLLVFRTAIKINTFSLKELSQVTGISKPKVSRIINKLRGYFIIRKRWILDFERLDLESLILVFELDNDLVNKLSTFSSPYLRALMIFKEKRKSLAYLNLIYPNSHYSRKIMHAWVEWHKDYLSFKDSDTFFMSFKEDILRRIYVQRPELYDSYKEEWVLGKPLKINELVLNSLKEIKKISLTSAHRQIALLTSAYSIDNFEQLFKLLRSERSNLWKGIKNRNKVHRIYKELIENKIIMPQIVMPFYSTLKRAMVVFKSSNEDFEYFVENFASRVPISITNYLPRGGALSFLGIPNKFYNDLNLRIKTFISDKGKMTYRVKSLEVTPALKLMPTDNGWKFKTPNKIFDP